MIRYVVMAAVKGLVLPFSQMGNGETFKIGPKSAEVIAQAIDGYLLANGLMLVPKDPTEAMVEAGRKAMEPEKFVSHARTLWVWSDMINATPPDNYLGTLAAAKPTTPSPQKDE